MKRAECLCMSLPIYVGDMSVWAWICQEYHLSFGVYWLLKNWPNLKVYYFSCMTSSIKTSMGHPGEDSRISLSQSFSSIQRDGSTIPPRGSDPTLRVAESPNRPSKLSKSRSLRSTPNAKRPSHPTVQKPAVPLPSQQNNSCARGWRRYTGMPNANHVFLRYGSAVHWDLRLKHQPTPLFSLSVLNDAPSMTHTCANVDPCLYNAVCFNSFFFHLIYGSVVLNKFSAIQKQESS